MPIHHNIRRCTALKFNGQQCGSPALRTGPRCHYHAEIIRRRNALRPQFLDNPADVQVAVMDTLRALLERRIDRSHAAVVLYGLQLAQGNIRTSGFRAGADKAKLSGSLVSQVLDCVQTAQDIEIEGEINQPEDVEKARAELAKSLQQQGLKIAE